jgi:hypothetical protein
VLEARCGEGGYHYIVAADNFSSLDGAEQNGESAVTGQVGRTGLSVPEPGVIDYQHAPRALRRAISLVRGLFGENSGGLKPALFGDCSLVGC